MTSIQQNKRFYIFSIIVVCAGLLVYTTFRIASRSRMQETSDAIDPDGEGLLIGEIRKGDGDDTLPPDYSSLGVIGFAPLNGPGVPIFALPAIRLEAGKEQTTSQSIEDADAIEFVPLKNWSLNSTKTERVQTWIYLSDGTREKVGEHEPHSVFPRKGVMPNEWDFLAHRVRIELAAFRERALRIGWEIVGADSPGSETIIADFKIRKSLPQQPSAPHILLICSDTHRADYAFEGHGPELMPKLNEYAKGAIIYQDASSVASWTYPSIASMLTGLFPRNHNCGYRVRAVPVNQLNETRILPNQFWLSFGSYVSFFDAFPELIPTVADLLAPRGYERALVASNGFYVHSGLFAQGWNLSIFTGVRSGNVINDHALRIIREAQIERPNFLLVHYIDVHEYKVLYGGALAKDDKNPTPEEREHQISNYRRAVSDTDTYASELIAAFETKFGRENSAVIFTSDHGEHLYENAMPLTGHGNTMDEELMHVPMMVRLPERLNIQPGISDRAVSLVDIMPTILELAGAQEDIPDIVDGVSFLESDESAKRPLYADFQMLGDELSSVRENGFKWTRNFNTQEDKLVDLANPGPAIGSELEPGISYPEREEELRYAFEAYEAATAPRREGLKSSIRVDHKRALETLQELGYIGK